MLRNEPNATQKRNLLGIVLISGVLLLSLPASAAEEKISPIPSYLEGYQELYQRSPRDAALQWFHNAKYGLFMHFPKVDSARINDQGVKMVIRLDCENRC